MDQLLKKFEKIEINHSSCLEKEDQEFCEKQQQIYECVLRHFRAMFRGLKMLHDKECRQPPLTVIRAILSGQTGTSPAINRYAAKGSLHE